VAGGENGSFKKKKPHEEEKRGGGQVLPVWGGVQKVTASGVHFVG